MTRCGRFAPSPTGPLHLGSLATALASWLDAKAQGYLWLIRMEDLDPPRQEAGAADFILQQLLAHGLQSDHVLYQSTRYPAYTSALDRLIAAGLAYPCGCSRKKIHDAHAAGLANTNADGEIIYPGFCRSLVNNMTQDTGHIGGQISWRFRNPNGDDFVIRRADGFWAYHLASVVDDAHQGITDIVRGSDLAAAAERHDALRQALGYEKPFLMHVPVMSNQAGEKLSKQTKAKPLAISPAGVVHDQLAAAWDHLQRVMPHDWISTTKPCFLQLASTIKA